MGARGCVAWRREACRTADCTHLRRLLVPFPRGKGTRPTGRNPARRAATGRPYKGRRKKLAPQGETLQVITPYGPIFYTRVMRSLPPHPVQCAHWTTIPIPSGLRPSPLDKGSRPPKGKAGGRAPPTTKKHTSMVPRLPTGRKNFPENGPGAHERRYKIEKSGTEASQRGSGNLWPLKKC